MSGAEGGGTGGNRTKGTRYELAFPDELWSVLVEQAKADETPLAEFVRQAVRDRCARRAMRRRTKK